MIAEERRAVPSRVVPSSQADFQANVGFAPVSPLGPAPRTQSSHRSHCPSIVPSDLADPAPRSPLRGTRPSGRQTIEATAHLEDDPATPKARVSDRTTESSTKPSISAMIFDPGVPPASVFANGSQGPPFSVTHTIAAYRSAAPFMTRVASAAQRLCSNGVRVSCRSPIPGAKKTEGITTLG